MYLAELTASQREKVNRLLEIAPVGVKNAINALAEHDWNLHGE